MLEFRAVPFVPEVGLIDAISTLTEVHRFEMIVEGFQLLAPPIFGVDAVSHRERISGTDDSDFSCRDGRTGFMVASNRHGVGAERSPRSIHIFDVKIWLIDPADF